MWPMQFSGTKTAFEISKEFSTPKSKIFINGILDKILFELRKEKKIIKSGRGLIE